MGEQEELPVVAHPEVFVYPEPAVGRGNPERDEIGRMPGTVGQYFPGGRPYRVDPSDQLVVRKKRRHGVPRVVPTPGVAESDFPAYGAGCYQEAVMDRLRWCVVDALHMDHRATGL